MPQIEVTFDIDANGIVNVSAKDRGTGKEQKITITASSGLNKTEVDRMMREAEAHADEDKRRREEIETRNRADQAVYGAEKVLQDAGDKLPAADREAVEQAIGGLKKAIEGADVGSIDKAMEQLTRAQHKAAEALYAGAQKGGQPGGAGRRAARRPSWRRRAAQRRGDRRGGRGRQVAGRACGPVRDP
jgi:molecular chaperone DnaK